MFRWHVISVLWRAVGSSGRPVTMRQTQYEPLLTRRATANSDQRPTLSRDNEPSATLTHKRVTYSNVPRPCDFAHRCSFILFLDLIFSIKFTVFATIFIVYFSNFTSLCSIYIMVPHLTSVYERF